MASYSLNPSERSEIPVDSKLRYSSDTLKVKTGEKYRLSAKPEQRWKDWFISTSPNGFANPIATLAGLRVKKARCFCLCGCYDHNDVDAFPIGTLKEESIRRDGILSFFANDALGYYKNNSGVIILSIERLS